MTVVDVLGRSPAPPEAIALVDGETRWTYEQLGRAVDERVAELASSTNAPGAPDVARGHRPGTVVPVTVVADAAAVVELLALWRWGSIPAPLNARLTAAEKEAAEARLATPTIPPETQIVLWTSGTSGRPRGVALSFANLEHSTRAVAERLSLSARDAWLATLSPAHVGGLALMVRSVLLGGTLACAGAFDASRMWDLLEGRTSSHNGPVPTHVSLVPTQLLRLLDHRPDADAPRGLRCVLLGGAYAPASLVERALAHGWPLAVTYGATEATSQVATSVPDLTRRKPGTVGPPLSGVELRLTAAGEIVVRGPTRALGYVGADQKPLGDESGWYHTGDLGRLDDDGHLWITGRRLDRIVTGGITVDAVEVEEALRAHPTVLDACVVGLPDDEWGERIAVWVEAVEGEFDVESVSSDMRMSLSAAKLPRVWYVAGGLPRNANGKVDRGQVRQTLEAEPEKAS